LALIVVDANLLLYSYDPDAPLHRQAKAWLESVMSGRDTVGIPFLAITAFLRINTNTRLPRTSMRMAAALEAIDQLLSSPTAQVLHTDAPHWEVLRQVLSESGVVGRNVSDAQFAAFAIQYNATLFSTDKHFARFPGLKWKNPLKAGR
jgi:toxin-antitoxin system PIN domain toxin